MRIGIWGSGFMAATHARNLCQTNGIELAGVADIDENGARRLIQDHGGTRYADCAQMLESESIDLLVCAVPPGVDKSPAILAASRGIHLLLEKPIALDLAMLKRIETARQDGGGIAAVDFHLRAHPSIQALRTALADGSAGRPCQFSSRFWMNGDVKGWWKDPQQSGGQIIEQLIHNYDLARYCFGEVSALAGFMSCQCKGDDPAYQVEDNSIGILHFANGALGHISGSNTALRDRFIADWRIICEHLVIEYTSNGDWREQEAACHIRNSDNGTLIERIVNAENLHAAAAADLLAAIHDRRAPRAPLADAIRSHELVFAMADHMKAASTAEVAR